MHAVVGFAGCELKFAHRDTKPSHNVHVGHILKNPTACFKLLVDVLAGFFFG